MNSGREFVALYLKLMEDVRLYLNKWPEASKIQLSGNLNNKTSPI